MHYWLNCETEICKFFRQEERKAKKEHRCCECRGIIPIGVKYLYIVGKWYSDFGDKYGFEQYPTCLSCDRDWKTVINVFHDNGEKGACIVFGLLEEAVRDAFESMLLNTDSFLVRRWLPDVIESKTEEEVEADTWKRIEASAIRKGLQPALPLAVN